jgi:hypothetical protein
MSRWTKVSIWAAAFVIGVGVGLFLITRGISQAALWATALGLPIAVLGSAAGAWSAVLAARTLREARAASANEKKALKKAHVELVDASPDPGIQASFASSEPQAEAGPDQPHVISDIKLDYRAIDFKFVNRGDATAVLHRFGLEILSFQPDLTPLLRHSYRLTREEIPRYRSMLNRTDSIFYDMESYPRRDPATMLELKVRNDGWGDASQYSVRLTDPVLTRLFPEPMLAFSCAAVPSGGDTAFTIRAEDANPRVLEEMTARRRAILEKVATTVPSPHAAVLDDEDYNLLTSEDERMEVFNLFRNYRPDDVYYERERGQFGEYMSERYSQYSRYFPVGLDAEVRYLDEDENSHVEQKDFSPERHDRGILWLAAAGFRYEDHSHHAMMLESGGYYSVILEPEGPQRREYPISRSIRPGDADRFHIIVAARRSGTFVLRLTFKVNRRTLVTSKPISISLVQPLNWRLPDQLADGASFQFRDGRLQLGGEEQRDRPRE